MRRRRSEWRRDDWILVVLGSFVILLLTFSFLTFARVVIDSLEPIDQVSTQFLTSIRADDYDTAFALLSTELRAKIGNPQGLRGIILEVDAIPESWEYDTHHISDNVYGEIGGMLRQKNGDRHYLTIMLRKVDEHWSISRFQWGQFESPLIDK